MSRRPLVLLALLVSSFVVSACADITAPRHDDTTDATCRSGYMGSDGRCVQ
jgi:hypothetical protein